MLKLPRYIKEYANYKIKMLLEDYRLSEEFKNKKLEKYRRAVNFYQKGFITIDETMYILSDFDERG